MVEWCPARAFLLIARARQTDAVDDLVEGLVSGAREIARLLPTTRVRVTRRIVEDPADAEWPTYRSILEGGLSNGVLLRGFDAAVRIESPTLDVAGVADLLAEQPGVRERVDKSASTATVGSEIAIFDPIGPVTLIYAMRRNLAVDHAEFSAAWQRHAAIAEGTPRIAGYRQLHSSPEDSATANRRLGLPDTGIDGVVLASFASITDFSQAVGGPTTFTKPSLESEQRFNAISRATAVLTRLVFDSGDRRDP
jgi:hypothetical protein